MKRLIILLLKFTDWVLRTYENEPEWYPKGYFTQGLVKRLSER